ncbi:MAG: YjbQ family protein [Erysipelotrichaceae bacterium]|nr:YjbQ family protein [Erysipelotrichaceae bacterium]
MIKIKHLCFETKYPKIHFFDITNDIKKFIKESQVNDGTVTVQSEHTTCAIFFEEYVHDVDRKGHDFLQIDLNEGLRRVFPDETEFNGFYRYPGPAHLNREGRTKFEDDCVCLNGPAHLKSTIIGVSQTFVIENGELQTGKFGSIWFVDFDYLRARNRKCVLCINGE